MKQKFVLTLLSIIVIVVAFLIYLAQDKASYINLKIRQLLGIKSLSEFLVDFEL